MTMAAEQLKELLAMLDNEHALDTGRAMDELFYLAPSLARKVIAAEKVVHEVRAMMNAYHSGKDIYGWADAVSEAIDTWEALK